MPLIQIMPAPTAVATLAQLAILSTSHQDFPLVEPARGFQRVNHPESFKACLMQVANEGYEAFNLAHVGMDEVRLATLGIPQDMKFVVQILMKGTDREVQLNLPRALAAIDRAADVCLVRSNEVVEKYESVRELIDELNETGMSTKGANEKEKAELELQRKNEELTKQYLEEEKAKAEAETAKLKEQLDKREKEYEDALESMPGPWTIFGLKLAETGMELAESGLSTMMGDFSSVIGGVTKGLSQLTGGGPVGAIIDKIKGAANPEPEKPKRMSAQTKLVYRNLKIHVDHIELGQTSLFDEQGFNKDDGNLNAMRKYFSMGEDDLAQSQVDPKLKERVEPFYNAVKATLEKVDITDDTNVQAVKDELKFHHLTALQFQSEASDVLSAGLQRATPEEVRANKGQPQPAKEETMGDMATRNAQAKVETTTAMFRDTQERYAETNKNLLETNQMLNKSLLKISELDASTASLRDILAMLKAVRF